MIKHLKGHRFLKKDMGRLNQESLRLDIFVYPRLTLQEGFDHPY